MVRLAGKAMLTKIVGDYPPSANSAHHVRACKESRWQLLRGFDIIPPVKKCFIIIYFKELSKVKPGSFLSKRGLKRRNCHNFMSTLCL